MSVQKGVAKIIGFDLVTTAGAEDTTGTPTTQISKDGGAYAATTNAAARIGSTGSFSLALTSAEMTADLVKIRAVASGDVPVFLNLYTESDYTTTRAGYIVQPPTNWGAASIDSSGRMLLQPTQPGVTIPTVTTLTGKTGFSLATAPPTSDQIAAKILVNPAHLLATDSSGNVAANNLPVEVLTSAEQGELTDAVNDLVALLGRTDTAATVSTIATAVTTLLSRLPASISFTNGNVNANAVEWGGAAVAGMPLAASAYTAPDNTDIATALADVASLIGRTDPTTALTAIRAITDQITFTNGLVNSNATATGVLTTEQADALALINVALAGLTTAPGTPTGLARVIDKPIQVTSGAVSEYIIKSGNA